MMRRSLLFMLTLVLATSVASQARADWSAWFNRFKLDWHRNNAWPAPFQDADRELVRRPFRIMVNKGWQMQNTLDTNHFNPATNELTPAGIAKVRWIVDQRVPYRRTVFVLRDRDPEITAARIDSAQQHVAGYLRNGELPAVVLTDLKPQTSPADRVNQIHTGFQSGLPAPSIGGGVGGGGGGGAGGGGGGSP